MDVGSVSTRTAFKLDVLEAWSEMYPFDGAHSESEDTHTLKFLSHKRALSVRGSFIRTNDDSTSRGKRLTVA